MPQKNVVFHTKKKENKNLFHLDIFVLCLHLKKEKQSQTLSSCEDILTKLSLICFNSLKKVPKLNITVYFFVCDMAFTNTFLVFDLRPVF